MFFVDRVPLTIFVVQAHSSYVMQVAYIPHFKCDEIDNRCKKFIWGDSETDHSVHTVSWSKISKPKPLGGLVPREAKNINQTAMLKLNWNWVNNMNDVWVQLIRSKYGCGNDLSIQLLEWHLSRLEGFQELSSVESCEWGGGKHLEISMGS